MLLPELSLGQVFDALGCPVHSRKCVLDSLYPDTSVGGKLRRQKPTASEQKAARGGGLTYGEIKDEGFESVLSAVGLLEDVGDEDHLWDLGSGHGRAVMHAFVGTSAREVVGVELVESRSSLAFQAIELLHKSFPDGAVEELHVSEESRLFRTGSGRTVRFEIGDFLKKDLSHATVVYTASTVFPESLMIEMAEHLGVSLIPGAVLVSLKKIPWPHPGLTLVFKLGSVHTTWSPFGSAAFVYVSVPPAPSAADFHADVLSRFALLAPASDVATADAIASSWGSDRSRPNKSRLKAVISQLDRSIERICNGTSPALKILEFEALWVGGLTATWKSPPLDEALEALFSEVRKKGGLDSCHGSATLAGRRNTQGRTLLHLAATAPKPSCYKEGRCTEPTPMDLLVDVRGDPDVRDVDGLTPLHVVADNKAAEALLGARADPDVRTPGGRSALHSLVVRRPRVAEVLVHGGADVNARDFRGITPLHLCPDASLAKSLIEQSADPDVADDDGKTAIHWCAAEHSNLVSVLIASGAGASRRDSGGDTALHSCPAPEVVALLLAHRADVDIENKDDRTALFSCAVNSSRLASAKLLLRARASATAADASGRSVLHEAAKRGNGPLAQLLVDARAETSAVDGFDRTPVDYARGNAEVLQVLHAAAVDVAEHAVEL